MPLYEYQCEACQHRFERIQKFSDPPIDVCPVCGGAVKKLVSSPAIQFKGSGWYITDYAKKPSGEAKAGGGAKESSGSESSAAGAPAKEAKESKDSKESKSSTPTSTKND